MLNARMQSLVIKSNFTIRFKEEPLERTFSLVGNPPLHLHTASFMQGFPESASKVIFACHNE